MAVAIADGATTLSDVRVLGDQPGLFGEVASVPTMWRTLEATNHSALERIEAARANARAAAWAAGMDPGCYVIDIDATLVNAHSDKEGAAPNYKHGFGFAPMVAFLDATGEALAAILRPGNAAAGSAQDHVRLLDAALAQLPVDPLASEVIARTDSAGASHGFVDACRERGVRFSWVTASAPSWLAWSSSSRHTAGRPPFRPVTEEREVGLVAEITDLVDSRTVAGRHADGGAKRRAPSRRTAHLHRRRRPSLPALHHQPPSRHLPFGSRLSRPRTMRVAIRDSKDTGLDNLSWASSAINQAWLALVLTASDLLAWMRGPCLEGALQGRAQTPALHALAQCGYPRAFGSPTTLRRRGWPWADDLVTSFAPLPGWMPATT